MDSAYEFGQATHVGLVRTNNEDAMLSEPETGLWLIADGMGGHDAGEVASSIAKTSISDGIKQGKSIDAAIRASHHDIIDAANNNIGGKNMGTTVIALLSYGSEYDIAWVGDSRAYLWNTATNTFKQISKDHSYVQSLVDQGLLTIEEMNVHPQRNVITQSLGIAELGDVEVDVITQQWQEGDKVLLCSDGLSDLVEDNDIAVIFRKFRSKSNQQLADALVETALSKGGKDNVSVQVISCPDLTKLPNKTNTNKWHKTFLTLTVCSFVFAFLWLLYKK